MIKIIVQNPLFYAKIKGVIKWTELVKDMYSFGSAEIGKFRAVVCPDNLRSISGNTTIQTRKMMKRYLKFILKYGIIFSYIILP